MHKIQLFPIVLLGLLLLILIGCDPMSPQATPVAIIVTSDATATPTLTPSLTPTFTLTPSITPTPNFTPTPTAFPCEADGGEIIEFNQFRNAESDNENLRYHVYIPPCYSQTQRRYPYVILLHGLSYREQQWTNIGVIEALEQGIALGVLPPMILVMPYMGILGTQNTFPPDSSYETFIMEALVPQIETDFCTYNNRDFRGIGGISRGGFWAYGIGFRHPDTFGIIGGHSAFFPESLLEVPAASNPLEIAENSALLPNANLRLYLDNGASDSAASSQRAMSDRLTARGIPHTYIINTIGDHSEDYWSAQVSNYLEFYGQTWPRGHEQLPSCAEASP